MRIVLETHVYSFFSNRKHKLRSIVSNALVGTVLGTKQYQFRCFQNCRFQEVIASTYILWSIRFIIVVPINDTN